MTDIKQIRSGILCVLAATLLASCGSKKETYIARDVETLYNLAADQIGKGDYELAAAFFDEVERQHPYSIWARRAQLMSSYAAYKAHKYNEAILAAQRFLTLHPGNRDADYAYYLIGLCYYERIVDVKRDQKITDQALSSFTELVRRYPDSRYANDARLKIDLTRDQLAGKEMAVGRWYQLRHEYLAASKRFKAVIDNYETTSHVPEAMHRLVETYLRLGLREEARRVGAVLGYNYPGNRWYRRTYALLENVGPEQVLPLEKPEPSEKPAAKPEDKPGDKDAQKAATP